MLSRDIYNPTENNDIDLGFETFFRLFNKTLDRHGPTKKSTRKKEKIKSKPWITKGMKSISIMVKLYKKMIKEKNVLTKVLMKHKSFKKY